VAADGITVNNVLPGPILTDRQRSLLARQGDLEAALAARSARHPMLRIGRPEEVGDVIAFLASTRAGFVTGVSVLVDGGESRVLA
jgi:3-oxoacyl-[acyl-carrier protein] reductase